jgi:hypothetical protein
VRFEARTAGVAFALALTVPTASWAQETASQSAPAAPAETAKLGLAVDLGLSSVYVFRGYNMFQTKSQWNQHPFAAPSITYSIPATNGLAVGYWGAYQFAGPNIVQAMQAGLGAENDLFVTYSQPVVGPLTAGLGFTAYIYPLATEEAAGTLIPVYLEPAVFVSLTAFLDVGLKLAYYHGVQEAIGAYRYVYANPTAGKTFVFNDRASLALAASCGLKLFIDTTTPVSHFNNLDILLSAAVPITLIGPLYVKPSVSWAWTNFPDRSATEQMVVFGNVNLGANL